MIDPETVPHELGILGTFTKADRESFYENRICVPTPDENACHLGRVQFLAKWHKIAEFNSVLDIGCHDGFATRWLLKDPNLHRLMGIDICKAAIQEAIKALDTLPVHEKIRANYRRITWEDYANFSNVLPYELVVCFEVIEHFHMDEVVNLIKTINEKFMHPIFGRCLISTPDKNGPWGLANDQEREHITLFEPQELLDLIEDVTKEKVDEMLIQDGLILTTWGKS